MSEAGYTLFRTLLSIVLIVALGYIVLSTFLFFFQSRFVYFPTKKIDMTPENAGLEYEKIRYETSDGIEISAWYIPVKESNRVVLFCHGNAGNISHRIDSIKIFIQLGLNVFIFDYRGYGESAGKPTENGTYLDVMGAWNYLTQSMKFKQTEIVFFGRSLGGAVAAWLAQKYTPGALIVESSFTSVPDLGSKYYPFLPVRLLSRFSYNTREYIKKVKCPVLIIHSQEDEIIPFSHGQKIFASANSPKKFLQIYGSHNEGFILSQIQYMNGLKGLISSLEP